MIYSKNPMANQKADLLNTIGYYASFIAFGLIGASLGPSLPFIAEMTQTDFSQISMVFTARSLGFIIGVYIGGRLIDKIQGHPLMALTLAVLAIVASVIPHISFLWLLVFVILMDPD